MQGYTHFEATGRNFEKFINTCLMHGVGLESLVQVSQNKLKFKVKQNVCKNVLEVASKLCYNINVEKTTGLAKIKLFCLKNIAILLSLIVAVVGVGVLNFFVFQIKIYGTQTINGSNIIALLSQNGICVGAPKSRVNLTQVEQLIYANFEQASLISAVIYGNSLIINVNETLSVPEMHLPTPLIAKFDGKITKIDLLSGCPMVEVGDVVKRGDVLVSPQITTLSGDVLNVIPRANVLAEVEVSALVTFCEVQQKEYRTGSFKKYTSYQIFNFNYNLVSQSPYDNFQVEHKQTYIFNNFLLPLKKITTTFYQTAYMQVTINFKDEEQNLIKSSQKMAYANLPEGVEPIDEKTIISKNQNTYFVITYLKTIQTIT